MKKFFLALYAQLLTVTDIKHIRMWNNQLVLVMEGKMELFAFPAVFIEFDTSGITQLGGGVQLFDPLIFKIHILHYQLDSAPQGLIPEDTFEQNLDVYDLKDKIYLALQKFQPNVLPASTTAVSACVRTGEWQDYEHAGIYHYIQQYTTTYTDNAMREPVGGSTWPDCEEGTDPSPQVGLELDVTIQDSVDTSAPHIYNFDV